jgi:AraC-like DNA-binding protein
MADLELTGLARIPLHMLNHVEEVGLDRGELMHAAGLDEAELRDPDARIPVSKIWNLWRIVIERVPDPALGVRMGAAAKVREFGIVGYTMLFSATLRGAFDRLARYSHVLSKAVEYVLEPEADHTRLMLERSPRFDALHRPLDARLSVVVAAAREITGTEVSPLEVHFPYERPLDVAEHQRYFRCPLRFDEPRAAVLFRNDDLDRPVAAGDETLSLYLDRLADEVMEELKDRSSISVRVRRAIWTELGAGPPTLERIASALSLSPRTLQRRLRDAGTSFCTLLDSFRQQMALHLLRDRNLAIYEVAFLLGYSDPSAFYRAFRRWRGTAPDEFRRTMC